MLSVKTKTSTAPLLVLSSKNFALACSRNVFHPVKKSLRILASQRIKFMKLFLSEDQLVSQRFKNFLKTSSEEKSPIDQSTLMRLLLMVLLFKPPSLQVQEMTLLRTFFF